MMSYIVTIYSVALDKPRLSSHPKDREEASASSETPGRAVISNPGNDQQPSDCSRNAETVRYPELQNHSEQAAKSLPSTLIRRHPSPERSPHPSESSEALTSGQEISSTPKIPCVTAAAARRPNGMPNKNCRRILKTCFASRFGGQGLTSKEAKVY